MRLGEGKTRLLQSSRAIDDTAISTSTQLADNMTHLVQRACLPSLTSTKKPSTQPTHGFCSVIKLDKNEKKNGSFLPALRGGDGGYFLALVLAPYCLLLATPLVATTLALVLLGLLMEIHTPASACGTPQILGFTLWQLLSYCQEEVIHVHSCLG